MKKQFKFIGISSALTCLSVGLALTTPVQAKANSLNTLQNRNTENVRNTGDRLELNSLKTSEQIIASLQNKSETKPVTRRLAIDRDIDPRGQMQESVEEKINALSPLKQRNFFKKHFPVIVNQKPKTGIKRIFKNNNGIVLKKEYRNGKVKYFDRKGNYLKQKNIDGSWQFKIGYSTERDWHLQII